MYKYSASSLVKLSTCHPYLQVLFREVIKEVDITILYGHRTIEEQKKLYAFGRTEAEKIVTNCDGVNVKSKHNAFPSLAIDIAPYPLDWNNIERFKQVAEIVKRNWNELKADGIVDGELYWGGDWQNLRDYPHFELLYVKP
jgi:peptidoglycan LD-endopeptidase CwlK